MPFFETPSGYACHYELHGDGEAKILLIMGFACCRLYWSELVERLLKWGDENETPTPTAASSSPTTPRKQNRYQICIYDSRGFGQSGDSLTRYSSSNLARDAKALLMHLRWIRPERTLLANDLDANSSRAESFARLAGEKYIPPPLHIVGWSMGGMIATELTLDLLHWSEQRRSKYPQEGPSCDFRSSVLTATSRGGFTHRGEDYDAAPLPSTIESETNWSIKRWWRRSKLGRWRWGKTWFIRNLPPVDGLIRIFRVAFLSFYHSRIERVLELHYSQSYLDQPFRAPKNSSTPSASALSHLPINSAAITSASKPTIEVHADRATGGFSLKQEAQIDPLGPDLVDDPTGGDSDQDGSDSSDGNPSASPSATTREIEVEERASPEEIVSKPSTVELTPAEKYRLLQREQEQEEAAASTASSSAGSPLASGSFSPQTRYQSSPSLPSRSLASSGGRVLTNREVLSSQYLLRSPFDRYIGLYLFALLGHGLTCLTHHVSRKRIREFLQLQEQCKQRKDAHLLRLMCITGSSDILVHPSNSFHLAQQFDCPLYVLEGVGHMVHVEEPEAFATLLHAFFTRQKVQHLQGYHPARVDGASYESVEGSPRRLSSASVSRASPSPPQLIRTASEGASNLTLTPMDAETSALESGLTSEEAALIATRAGSSRRNSYLVQIDDPLTGFPKRTDSKDSLASATSFFSARHNSRSASLSSRRGSFSALQAEKRAKESCLARTINKLTNMPLATAGAVVNLAVAVPKFCWGLLRHPTTVFDLPARAYGAFKQQIGGAVLKRNTTFTRGDHEPTARVIPG